MLALEIELLRGQYVATAYNDRWSSEWPPHPARVFSALVAAHHAADAPDPAERRALEWLQALPPPRIAAGEARRRSVSKVFVPINDTSVLASAQAHADKLAEAQGALSECLARLEEVESDGNEDAKVRKEIAKAQKAVDKAQAALVDKTRKITAATSSDLPQQTLKSAASLLPSSRSRKERTFPVSVPHQALIYFIWPEAEPEEQVRASLATLLTTVTRIGHSSSLVRCALVDDAPEPDYLPDDAGDLVLRVTQHGQLGYLETDFEKHREVEPRVLPCAFQTYSMGGANRNEKWARPSLGGEWIVFRRVRPDPDERGSREQSVSPPAIRAVDVAEALYGAVLSHAVSPIPEVLTGHSVEGGPSRKPHLACIALANVGWEHADGRILGAALVLPRDISEDERMAVLAAVGRWERAEDGRPLALKLGRAGVMRVVRETGRSATKTLSPRTWRSPARDWATVTPIALDRHPGDIFDTNTKRAARAEATAEDLVAASCERAGLPPPVSVRILRDALLKGSEAAGAFGPFPREKKTDRPRRLLVHAALSFESPVHGPLLLGAGRYRGLGLFRPLARKEER